MIISDRYEAGFGESDDNVAAILSALFDLLNSSYCKKREYFLSNRVHNYYFPY